MINPERVNAYLADNSLDEDTKDKIKKANLDRSGTQMPREVCALRVCHGCMPSFELARRKERRYGGCCVLTALLLPFLLILAIVIAEAEEHDYDHDDYYYHEGDDYYHRFKIDPGEVREALVDWGDKDRDGKFT